MINLRLKIIDCDLATDYLIDYIRMNALSEGRKSQKDPKSNALKRVKLVVTRLIPLIISYSRKVAKKMKKRNQYELVLFPNRTELPESTEVLASIKKEYSKNGYYPFYLSKCNLFIDNYHLKIIKKSDSIPYKFHTFGYGDLHAFANWVSQPQIEYLIFTTSYGWVVVINANDKSFTKFKVYHESTEECTHLVNASVYEDYIFAFSKRACTIAKFKNVKGNKGMEIVSNVILKKEDGEVSGCEGINFGSKFYLFGISDWKCEVVKIEAKTSTIYANSVVMCSEEKEKNVWNNIKIKAQIELNRVIVIVASDKFILLFFYDLQSDRFAINYRFENLAVPWQNVIHKKFNFVSFMQKNQYLLVAFTYFQRLYFIKIEGDNCVVSKRAKFEYKVQFVSPFGTGDGILIVLDLSTPENLKKKILLTHFSKLVSFGKHVNTELTHKYTFQFEQPLHSHKTSTFLVSALNQLLVTGQNEIFRFSLSTWDEIYFEMSMTQNIKLLRFLILLKNVDSPFLKKPPTFTGLEAFFPTTSDQEIQILFEYYYLMNIEPKLVKVQKHQELMCPFIIEHKIYNLCEATKEKMMKFWMAKDERMIEELIVGGAECGWDIAISKGWARAFRVMVELGMEIEMPFARLTSLMIAEIHREVEDGEEVVTISENGKKICNQMIDYTLLILNTFFLEDTAQNCEDLKHLLLTILTPIIWQNEIRFSPRRAAKIISSIFLKECRIKMINSYLLQQFLQCHFSFSDLEKISGYSISEMIVSHMSETFRQQHSDQKLQFLMMEHGKLLMIRFNHMTLQNSAFMHKIQDNLEIYMFLYSNRIQELMHFIRTELKAVREKYYFYFTKEYLKNILHCLVEDTKENLDKIFKNSQHFYDRKISQSQLECQMVDFTVLIWKQIYMKIMREVYAQKTIQKYKEEEMKQSRKKVREEIRSLILRLELLNYKYHYLIIEMMISINWESDYSIKIFKKFIQCRNPIIKNRIFSWLSQSMANNPQLQEEVITNLKELLETNKEETRILLETYYQNQEKDIIKKIDNDPALQLDYVELIIKNSDSEVEEYYSNLHVKLILSQKPETLIDFLEHPGENVKYDIHQVLRLALDTPEFDKKFEILTYLYEKEGEITNCLQTYLKIFESLLYQYIRIAQNKSAEEESQELIVPEKLMGSEDTSKKLSVLKAIFGSGQLSKISLLCESMNKNYTELVTLLFRQLKVKYEYLTMCLDSFNSLKNDIIKSTYKSKLSYQTSLAFYMGQFIIQMLERNYLLQLSQWIKSTPKIHWFDLQKYFVEGYRRRLALNHIVSHSAQMDRNILVQEIQEGCKSLELCISCTSICIMCETPIEGSPENEGLLFNCGHIYHKGCIEQLNDEDYCWECIRKNTYLSMIQNSSLNLVDLLIKFQSKKYQVQISPAKKEEAKKKMAATNLVKKRANRFGIFDKKVTAIENQAEIIDLKLTILEYYESQNKEED